jgi:hypothetical protein
VSLKRMERALYICLEDETQKWLSISSAVVRDKAMRVQANLHTVSEIQESSIQGPHCP